MLLFIAAEFICTIELWYCIGVPVKGLQGFVSEVLIIAHMKLQSCARGTVYLARYIFLGVHRAQVQRM